MNKINKSSVNEFIKSNADVYIKYNTVSIEKLAAFFKITTVKECSILLAEAIKELSEVTGKKSVAFVKKDKLQIANKLAALVADGSTVTQAAEALKISRRQATRYLNSLSNKEE